MNLSLLLSTDSITSLTQRRIVALSLHLHLCFDRSSHQTKLHINIVTGYEHFFAGIISLNSIYLCAPLIG
jgi:hypothetical protein